MFYEGVDVEAGRVVDGTVPLDDGDHAEASGGHKFGCLAADVAETLDNDFGLFGVDLEFLEGFESDEEAAAAGGFGTSAGAAEVEGLAGDDSGNGVAFVHGVGIHDPGHGLLVGAHVGGWDVDFWPDDVDHFGGVAAGDSFELTLGEDGWVTNDASLAAAVGDVDDGALPGHPTGEGSHFVQGNVGGEADSAFGRTTGDGVLDAVAGEDLNAAVIEFYRDINSDFTGRGTKDF